VKIKCICKQCGKVFYSHPSSIKRGGGKFCSIKCVGLFHRGKNSPVWKGGEIKRVCRICGKEFLMKRCLLKIKGRGQTCSTKCANKNKKGEKHYRWKGGKAKRICKICGKLFYRKPFFVKKGQGDFCGKSCSAIWRMKHRKTKDTDIEIAIEKELNQRHISYNKQVPIPKAHTIVDFLLPNKIIIYCDGNFFHNSKWAEKVGKKNRDMNQNTLLSLAGYKVFRFSGTEIKKSAEKCIDIILEALS